MESSAWLASQSACSSCCSAAVPVREGRVTEKETKFLIRRYEGKPKSRMKMIRRNKLFDRCYQHILRKSFCTFLYDIRRYWAFNIGEKLQKREPEGIKKKLWIFVSWLDSNNIICSMQITMRQFVRAQELNCLLNAHLIMLFCILH